jgi:hypothetical protein
MVPREGEAGVNPLLVRPYVAAVSAYFRWGKRPLSRLTYLFGHKPAGEAPAFASLEEYAAWMSAGLRWRSDHLGGVWDVFPTMDQMIWQLEKQGYVEDDCDGLAYFSAQMVRQFADDPAQVYVVTLILNPRGLPLQRAAHVLCIFRAGGKWRVISNNELYPRRYATFDEALRENPYTRGQEIEFIEVRDADLKRVDAPAD